MTAIAETETRIANTVGTSRNEIRLAALWAVLDDLDNAGDLVRDTMPAWLKARSRATQQRNGAATDKAALRAVTCVEGPRDHGEIALGQVM